MRAGLRIAACAAALLAEPVTAAAQAADPPLPPAAAETSADSASGARDLPTATGHEAPLVRLLRERPARTPDSARKAKNRAPTLPECPRHLLGALFAEAAGRADTVSALAIEREVLAMCRDRQKVIGEILRLEAELRSAARAADPSPPAKRPVPRAAPPVRADTDVVAGARAKAAARPAAPAYAWFSIIGSPGRLQAGISDGAKTWFVREGDELPGKTRIEEIRARPPGVRTGGRRAARLPYRPWQDTP